LLKPAGRRARDGARLYTFDQVYKLTTIRYQQRLGKSLVQIADYLASRDIASTLDDLNQQMETVHQKVAELKLVEKMLEGRFLFSGKSFPSSRKPTRRKLRS
jgi:DNA-binding transcriptional MerR regulator